MVHAGRASTGFSRGIPGELNGRPPGGNLAQPRYSQNEKMFNNFSSIFDVPRVWRWLRQTAGFIRGSRSHAVIIPGLVRRAAGREARGACQRLLRLPPTSSGGLPRFCRPVPAGCRTILAGGSSIRNKQPRQPMYRAAPTACLPAWHSQPPTAAKTHLELNQNWTGLG